MLGNKLKQIRLNHFMRRFCSRQRAESVEGPSNVTSAISSEYGDDLVVKDFSRRLLPGFSQDSGRSLSDKLSRARHKLRAVALLRLMYRHIVLYGTSSGILDYTDCYKPRLPLLLLSRQVGELQHPPRTARCCAPFHPESPLKKVWNGLVMTLLVFTVVYVPVELSFLHSDDITEDITMTVIDYIFLIDVLVTFNTAYRSGEAVVYKRRAIALRYLRGTFLIDVISSIPLDLFSIGFRSRAMLRYVRLSRLVTLFRAARFHGTIRYLMKANEQSQQRVAAAVSRITGALVLLLLLTHLTACMWYFIATYDPNRWDNWITKFRLQDRSVGNLYLISLYWSITVLATIGYGDIHAVSNYEKMLACTWMLVGAVFFSFFLSTMSTVITGLNVKGGRIRSKLELLKVFCANLHLSKRFYLAMATQLQRSLKNNTLDQGQKLDLAMMLPKQLRVEVATNVYQAAARRVTFFEQQDPIFLANIVSMLEYRCYDKHETVYTKGAFADEVYFMGRGRVSFVIGPMKIPFRTLISGSFFGETEVVEELPREYTAITTEPTEVFVLTRNVTARQILSLVADEFPLVFQQLVRVARKRKELCLHSLIQSSHIIGEIEMGKQHMSVDKALLSHQIGRAMEKLEADLRMKSIMVSTTRQQLVALAMEVEILKRNVNVVRI